MSTGTMEKTKVKLAVPRKYQVIVHNDDETPVEFVLAILESYFGHTTDSATNLVAKIQEHGRGVAGIYSREVAEHKIYHVHLEAESLRYPLKLTSEPV